MADDRLPQGPQYVLEVVKGKKRGKAFDVTSDQVDMGRGVRDSQENRGGGIRFTEGSVSREQAALFWDEQRGRYRLVNRSRTNPTRVNGKAVDDALLNEGDEIRMGSVVLKWHAAAPRETPADDGPSPPPPSSHRPGGVARPRQEPRRARLRETVVVPRHQNTATIPQVSKPSLPPLRCRPKRAELAQLFGQQGVMLEAGIPLARALGGLAQKAGSPAVRTLCERLLVEVARGGDLWKAMQETGAFSRLHVHAVRAGEKSGLLPRVLEDLAMWEERDLSLTRAVTGSLTYPATVLVFGMLVLSVLGNRVFATLGPILIASGKPLPILTRILFAVSDVLQRPVPLLLLTLGICGTFWMTVRWVRTERGRLTWDHLALRLPLFGPLIRKLFVARFCNHMRLLYSSGIPLLDCVETSAAIVSNDSLRRSVLDAVVRLRNGVRLSECLWGTGHFPRMAIGLFSVGERTGRLDTILERVADLYDQEAYGALETMVKMLEPLVIVGLGVMVSVVVLGTLLPLYQVIQI